MILRYWLPAALVALGGVLGAVGACVPTNRCDRPEMLTETTCDGNILVTHHFPCDKGTADDTYDRFDCSSRGQVCLHYTLPVPGNDCMTPCTSDPDCPADAYCSPALKTSDGKSTCSSKEGEGFDCTNEPTSCRAGLECKPGPAYGSGVRSGAKTCQPDCTVFDAGSSTRCPVGANSVCVDAAVFACACGVAHQPIPCYGFCVDPSGTEAVCSLSPDPDPRCAASLDGGTGYLCDGTMRLACEEGYLNPFSTLDCALDGHRCVDGACQR